MTNKPQDIFDVARDALRFEARQERVARVRRRVLRAVDGASEAERLKPIARHRMGLGLAMACAFAMVAGMALLPGRGETSRHSEEPRHPSLRLVTAVANGALSRIDLDSASASQVFHAVGETAAAATPTGAGESWTYVRIEHDMTALASRSGVTSGPAGWTTERWTSADGSQSFSIQRSNPGPGVSVHYENLGRGIVGDVGWRVVDGRLRDREANWVVERRGRDVGLDQLVELQDRLRTVRDADDVAAALRAVMEGRGLEYRNGMQCVRGGTCMGIGGGIAGRSRISSDRSRAYYGYGLLIQQLASTVPTPASARAVYSYLASRDDLVAEPSQDDSSDIVLRWRPADAAPRLDVRLATVDRASGRIVSWDMSGTSTRYSAAGVADGPGVGGEICLEFPLPCEEIRELADRLEKDSNAEFDHAADWSRIAQVCEGILTPDGKRIPNALPRSLQSRSTAVRDEVEQCKRRARGRVEDGKTPFPGD